MIAKYTWGAIVVSTIIWFLLNKFF
jgi:hypothetical protein